MSGLAIEYIEGPRMFPGSHGVCGTCISWDLAWTHGHWGHAGAERGSPPELSSCKSSAYTMVSSLASSSLLCCFLCRLDARCILRPSAFRMSTPLHRRHVRGGPFFTSSFVAVNQFLHVQSLVATYS